MSPIEIMAGGGGGPSSAEVRRREREAERQSRQLARQTQELEKRTLELSDIPPPPPPQTFTSDIEDASKQVRTVSKKRKSLAKTRVAGEAQNLVNLAGQSTQYQTPLG